MEEVTAYSAAGITVSKIVVAEEAMEAVGMVEEDTEALDIFNDEKVMEEVAVTVEDAVVAVEEAMSEGNTKYW